MGKRRKGIDLMEDYGGSEDELQFGGFVFEVDQLYLLFIYYGNSVYDGIYMYDFVIKVDDMEFCDEIFQLLEV